MSLSFLYSDDSTVVLQEVALLPVGIPAVTETLGPDRLVSPQHVQSHLNHLLPCDWAIKFTSSYGQVMVLMWTKIKSKW